MSKQRKPAAGEPAFGELVSFRLHMLAKLVDQHAEASHRAESGLGLLECRIVGVVGAHGPISFKALCERAELEKSNASRLVARIIERGWIERQDDPADQRSFYLLPTAAGRRLRQAIHRNAQARNARWLSVLNPKQLDTLSTCLTLLQAQARAMLDGSAVTPAGRAAIRREEEPPRLSWIDRQLAEQLHALLGTALDKAPPMVRSQPGDKT